MNLAVVGSRSLAPQEAVVDAVLDRLDGFGTPGDPVTMIVTGDADGADRAAAAVARRVGAGLRVYPADWGRHGRAAGPIRNSQIVAAADACLALVDKPLAESRGTRDTVTKMRRAEKPVTVLMKTVDENGNIGWTEEVE